jgi:DNA-binding transcriptional LysR family regulator
MGHLDARNPRLPRLQRMQPTDLSLLVSLDALLQEGGVTGAARRVGLSTPAMSHALARIRVRMGDPILVRAGRGMALTPRAEALKPQVHQAVEAARAALTPPRPFLPHELDRTFVVHATDYVLTVLGATVDRLLREEAPGAGLRVVPNSADDAAQLRAQGSDLAVGIYGDLPPEMRARTLLTDRFVCVVRQGHPALRKRFTLDQFLAWPHLQVAPRGRPGGYVDDVLRERGRTRTVARAVPYFHAALQLAAETDYLLTISERVARRSAAALSLAVLEVPLPLRPYALSLVWHPRLDADEAHRFVRDVWVRAAREAAGERHEAPRTRLDASDPTSGQTRKRPRRVR